MANRHQEDVKDFAREAASDFVNAFGDAFNQFIDDARDELNGGEPDWEAYMLARENLKKAEAADYSKFKIGAAAGSGVVACAALGVYLMRKQKKTSDIEEAFLRA